MSCILSLAKPPPIPSLESPLSGSRVALQRFFVNAHILLVLPSDYRRSTRLVVGVAVPIVRMNGLIPKGSLIVFAHFRVGVQYMPLALWAA